MASKSKIEWTELSAREREIVMTVIGPLLNDRAEAEVKSHVNACEAMRVDKTLATGLRLLLDHHDHRRRIYRAMQGVK